jgi:hypothetical protein
MREVVVESLVFENKKETQRVRMYEDFTVADAVLAVNLEGNLEGLDEYGIMLLVAQAEEGLRRWSEGIFGREQGRKEVIIPRTLEEAGAGEYAGYEAEQGKDAEIIELRGLQERMRGSGRGMKR